MPPFARRVGRDADSALEAEHRGDVHDLAASLVEHDPARACAELERRREVDLDHVVPVGEVVVDRLRGAADAVRVHQDIEPAEPLDCLVEAAAEVLAVGQVGADRNSPDLRRDLVGPIGAPEHSDGRTRLCKRVGQAAPDAPARRR